MISAAAPSILYPAAIILAGIFLSLSMERLARPGCAGLRRPWSSTLVHAGLILIMWSAASLLVRRPIFALLLTLAGQFLVIQVSNAKYRALREPFIFSDFGIFSQAIRHPRLYLPFLGIGRALLVLFAVAGAAGIGLWLEQPAGYAVAWAGWFAGAGLIFMVAGLAFAPSPTLNPEIDLASRGLWCSIVQYWTIEKTSKPLRETSLPAVLRTTREIPDIVVIQSESFFDARRLFPGIRREVLRNFDEACAASNVHGRLAVPAWGANTMRPEFAFLTGMAPESLGVHRFNPYRRIARRPLRALPFLLREAGYRTTCIHPHPARFFRRDRAFPNIGFQRFIDNRDFAQAERTGPYISDAAVTDKLLQELDDSNQPAFFFVITMENHGPLHLEQVEPGEIEEFYREKPPDGCEDLTIYLRHLRNADRQIARLRNHLASRTRPTVLCFYGEHLPSMPSVYDSLGIPDGSTDYFLSGLDQAAPRIRDLRVQELPVMIMTGLH